MHFFHKRAEEAEIKMCGGAKRRPVSSRMHVRDVRANSEMDSDGNLVLIGGDENAGGGMLRIEVAACEKFSGGFPVAYASVSSGGGNLIEKHAGFAGHAESAGVEAGFDIFGSVAAKGDFEIVNEGGAVHGDAGNETAAHEIIQHGTEAGFYDVAADAPKDGFAGASRGVDGREEIAKIVDSEDLRERVQE